ncbi:MAG TPA: Gfo/Idh/MocA family oxidoreductase [Terriglobia bacterium]|nr:Gfo/Idh/MocA family oxidoreductase [Terriglobia bacterium]
MLGNGITRRNFLGGSAAVGLGVLAHPSFSAKVFGANDRIVMGIIGAGGMGRNHMETFKEQDVDWAGVCDVYGVHRDLGLENARSGATGYTDHRKLLERKDIDAVLIATPDHWHHDHLLDALQAGKDVYCEKPLSWSIEQGANMVNAVRKSDRIVQVGMQRRSSPIVLECKQLVDEGKLGEINLVRAEWYWNRTLSVKPVLESKLDWDRFAGPAGKQPFEPVRFRHWRYFWAFSGGNMTDQGTHLIDVIQWLTDAPKPLAAHCYGAVYRLHPAETPDTFCAVFEYPKFTCTWTLTYTNSYQNGWGIVFHGQKGTLELCETGYRFYEEPWAPRGRWERPEPTIEKLPGGVTRTAPHIKNFLECVRSRQQPNATIELGHQAVRTLHLANIAHHKKGRAVLGEDGLTVTV